MWKRRDTIDDIRIAAPCPTSWEAMAGDDRVRHCTLCDLNVYNLAELRRDEIRELFLRNEGRVCVRMYRRADGTILTSDCPTGLARLRARVSRGRRAAMAALLSATAFLSGCVTGGKSLAKRGVRDVKIEVEHVAGSEVAAFSALVFVGNEGSPLPGTTVTLHDLVTQRDFTLVTDINGVATASSLPEGTYEVRAEVAGLAAPAIPPIELRRGEVAHLRVAMHVAQIGEIMLGAVELTWPDGPSMTITQELLRKLPF